MATVKQTDVKWVPKDKKTGKGGFLALRSAPNKAFTGTVTGVKQGTTMSKNGVATYSGGKNVAAVAVRKSAKLNTPSAGRKAASTAAAKTRVAKATASKNIGYTAGGAKKPAAPASASRMAGAKSDAESRVAKRMPSKPAPRSASDWLSGKVNSLVSGLSGETSEDRKVRDLKNMLADKKRTLGRSQAARNATTAEKNRQTKLQQDIANLQKQINALK
jgi:hypothetical protein